jgi:mono/diheme cytochrome c family protein
MTARWGLAPARAVMPAAVAAVVLLGLAVGIATPPAPSAPARSGCVACHTDRAMLEPLVRPLPAAPAEGEG